MTDELRSRMRALRRSIPIDVQHLRAQALATTAASLPWWPEVATLGVYRAVAGELDTSVLEQWARGRGIETYVPVLDGRQLRFAPSTPTGSWSQNRFGIDEPDDADTIDAARLDLVVVPAVAVDRAGNRIGMGGGFYDRTFADRPRSGRPILVAAVHPEQLVERIVTEAWDVTMDAVVLPDEVIVVEGTNRDDGRSGGGGTG